MTTQSFISPELNHITTSLEQYCKRTEANFLLITQDVTTQFQMAYYGFSSAEGEGVLEVLKKDITSQPISLVRPALKDQVTIVISRNSAVALYTHYVSLFTSLNQGVCKLLAKHWIRIAEPKKQKIYPYKHRDKSAPPWWPPGVNHIDPDHLDKFGRIRVLITLLRNPQFSLEELSSKTTDMVFKYPGTHPLLHELYYLAFYDRAFYSKTDDPPVPGYSSLSFQDQMLLQNNEIMIPVSALRRASRNSNKVLMASQIKAQYLNRESARDGLKQSWERIPSPEYLYPLEVVDLSGKLEYSTTSVS